MMATSMEHEMKPLTIVIHNHSQRSLSIGLEPEGDVVAVEAGGRLEVRLSGSDNAEILFEYDVDWVALHASPGKEVWSGEGRRLR